jgi:hypothetical protein
MTRRLLNLNRLGRNDTTLHFQLGEFCCKISAFSSGLSKSPYVETRYRGLALHHHIH